MKKTKFTKYLFVVLIIISVLPGCSVPTTTQSTTAQSTITQSTYEKLDSLYSSIDYECVYNEYSCFFNDTKSLENLQKEHSDDYDDIIIAFQSKYLISILYTHKDEYIIQFENIAKDMSEFDFCRLLLNTYQTLIKDTKENEELCSQVVDSINKIEMHFDNSDYDSLYSSFVCFCNMTIRNRQENAQKADEIVNSLKEKYGEDFQDFWYNESTRYSGVLLHNRCYARFKVVFMSACDIEGYLPGTSISYLINMKNLDKEQLTFLSDTLYELSYATEDYTMKNLYKTFAELARTQNSQEA